MIVGACVSLTVMVNIHEPPPIDEVAVTVVVPLGKKDPLGGDAEIVPQSPVNDGGE